MTAPAIRALAVGAVLLALVLTIVLDAAPAFCAVVGTVGAVCLALVFARTGPPGVRPLPAPALAGAAGFAAVAMVADLLAGSLPWLPLIAPLTGLGLFGLVVVGLGRAAGG